MPQFLDLFRKPFVCHLILTLSTLLLYGAFLTNPFIFDDYYYPFSHEDFQSTIEPGLSFSLRSLSYATFTWTRLLLGTNIVWLRLGNLLLHVSVVCCLFSFLQRLFSSVIIKTSSEQQLSPKCLAFWGALIFALHPVMVYAVDYLNQRTILLTTLFTLLTWRCFLEGLIRDKYLWFLAAIATYALAVLAKEHGIMAAFITLLLPAILGQFTWKKLLPLLPIYLAFACIAILVIQQVKEHNILGEAYQVEARTTITRLGINEALPATSTLPSTSEISTSLVAPSLDSRKETKIIRELNADFAFNMTYVYSIITEAFLFFKYVGLWLIPNPLTMSVDMYYPFVTQFWTWPELVGLIGFIIYPIFGIRFLCQRGSKSLLGFAMLSPWLLFGTEFSVIRVQDTFVLYRNYLWMPAALAALPYFLQTLKPKHAIKLLCTCCLLLFTLSWQSLNLFSDPIKLWGAAARLVANSDKNLPGVERIFYNRASLLKEVKRYDEAVTDFSQAVSLAKDQGYVAVNAYLHRGVIYLQKSEFQLALNDFEHAIKLDPSNMAFYVNKGHALEGLNDPEGAQLAYKQGFMTKMPQMFAPAN